MVNIQDKPSCYHEYTPLKKVIMCPPAFFDIKEVINQVQVAHLDEPIDQDKAISQFQDVVQKLKEHGVQVMLLPPNRQFTDQIFTRDIGFVLGESLQIAHMKEPVRQGEETWLETWLKENGIPYFERFDFPIEGGDVLIHGNQLWIGESDRTSSEGINALQERFPSFEIYSVSYPPKYLHLDCVLSILSQTEAIVYPPAFTPKNYEQIKENWPDLIMVTEEEQFGLAVNVLSIGNKTVLSQPQFPRLNHQLRRRGYFVEEVDISEIVKSGGAFRCITLPLVRTEK
ncbi:MAG: arginine deiminase family protein [Thermoactinomyces sp.]